MQSQAQKDVVKNITTAAQLEGELQLSQAQHGVAVLDLYNAEWGNCKALSDTFRRLFTDAGDLVHLRFFSVECNAVLDSLNDSEEKTHPPRQKGMEYSGDTLVSFWKSILEQRQNHSKPYFAFYKEGKMRTHVEGIDTPRICRIVHDLCKQQNAASEYITNPDVLHFWESHFSISESEVGVAEFDRAARAVLGASAAEVSATHMADITAAVQSASGPTVSAAHLQAFVGDSGTVKDALLTIIAKQRASAAAAAPAPAPAPAAAPAVAASPKPSPSAAEPISAPASPPPSSPPAAGATAEADAAVADAVPSAQDAPADTDDAGAAEEAGAAPEGEARAEALESSATAAAAAAELHVTETAEAADDAAVEAAPLQSHPTEETASADASAEAEAEAEAEAAEEAEAPQEAQENAEPPAAAEDDEEAQPEPEPEAEEKADESAYPEEEAAVPQPEAAEPADASAELPQEQEEEAAAAEYPTSDAAEGAAEGAAVEETPAEAADHSEQDQELSEQQEASQTPSPPAPEAAGHDTNDPAYDELDETAQSSQPADTANTTGAQDESTINQIFTNRWVTVSEEEMHVWNTVAALPLHYPESTTLMADLSNDETPAHTALSTTADLPTLAEYLAAQGVDPSDINMMCIAADQKVGSESLSYGKLSLILMSCDPEEGKGLVPRCENFLQELSDGTLLTKQQPLAFTALALSASEAYPDECFCYCVPAAAVAAFEGLAVDDVFILNALTPLRTAVPQDGQLVLRIIGLPKVIELATTDESEDTMVLSQWYARLRVTEQGAGALTAHFVENVCDEEFQGFLSGYIARLIEDENRLDKKQGAEGAAEDDGEGGDEEELDDGESGEAATPEPEGEL